LSKQQIDRRRFLVSSAGIVGTAALTGCKESSKDAIANPPVPAVQAPPTNAGVIRVASVPTAVEGNLMQVLVAEFHKTSPRRVELSTNPELYGSARAGKVDLAISHYGHRDAEQFMTDGLGEWPRMVFSNQMAFVGPPSDPAKIRGLEDAVEAFKRIASTKSPFVMNEIDGIRYLVEVLWHAAGKPDRSGWLRDHKQEDALREASKLRAYTFWGLTRSHARAAMRRSISSLSCSPIRCCSECSFRSSSSPVRSRVSTRMVRANSSSSCSPHRPRPSSGKLRIPTSNRTSSGFQPVATTARRPCLTCDQSKTNGRTRSGPSASWSCKQSAGNSISGEPKTAQRPPPSECQCRVEMARASSIGSPVDRVANRHVGQCGTAD